MHRAAGNVCILGEYSEQYRAYHGKHLSDGLDNAIARLRHTDTRRCYPAEKCRLPVLHIDSSVNPLFMRVHGCGFQISILSVF